jgi:hypothetical protein
MNPFVTEELAREHYRRLLSVAAASATHADRRERRPWLVRARLAIATGLRRRPARTVVSEAPVLLCEDC